jgi:hypothetical protein
MEYLVHMSALKPGNMQEMHWRVSRCILCKAYLVHMIVLDLCIEDCMLVLGFPTHHRQSILGTYECITAIDMQEMALAGIPMHTW